MTGHRDAVGAPPSEPGEAGAPTPVGVVLAGGAGRRMGGAKAVVELNRVPLIVYALEAVWRAVGNVTIVAKPDTALPAVPGATLWIEPQEPRHPLAGIVYALSLAEGRPIVVCALDMPLVTAELIAQIAQASARRAPAVVASWQGEIQPLLARYDPAALTPLEVAAADPSVRLRDVVAGLNPVTYEVDDPECLFNVNSPDELLQAAAMLDRRRATRR